METIVLNDNIQQQIVDFYKKLVLDIRKGKVKNKTFSEGVRQGIETLCHIFKIELEKPALYQVIDASTRDIFFTGDKQECETYVQTHPSFWYDYLIVMM